MKEECGGGGGGGEYPEKTPGDELEKVPHTTVIVIVIVMSVSLERFSM